jgi:hypothetical protein
MKNLVGKPAGQSPFERDLCVNGRIILKCCSSNRAWEHGMDSTNPE